TTTGTGGAYSFTGVAPGTYQVQFTPLAGTSFTAQDQGGNDAVDSDVNASGRTAAVTIASGQTASNVSAGSFTPATLSGVFFTDSNGDGIQGTGEAGLAGQAVQLLNAAGTAVASTTTGTGGAYSFAGVTPGTYQVQFAAPAGSVFTAQDVGNNDAVDSDVGATGRTGSVTLVSGQAVANLSAGTFVPVTVSGVAFTDTNGDGVQGTGEAGIAGQAVQLLNTAGTVVATTTGTGGAYSFTGVAPGTYQVQFTPLAGTSFTAQDQGGNDAVDSDVNASGRTAAITIASGQTASNVSAGSFTPATLSGVFFTDTNGDGIQGTGEAGVTGQAVQLLNTAGTAVASTTTGTGGAYSFTGVAPGTYQVQFAAPTGTVFTLQDRGNNDALDSDVNAAGRTATVTLASGQTLGNVSAGTYTPATIGGAGGLVFTDSNGNGLRDGGEAGVSGATVRLLDADGAVVSTTTTGTGGTYNFAGLAPGQYQVQFTAPAGTAFTAQDQGGNDALDSDANPSTGRSPLFTVVSGQAVNNVAAGVFTPATTGTGNVVFVDSNGNGVRDAGEAGVAGVTVQLLNAGGTSILSTTTGSDGTYAFDNVTPGTYQVQFTAPAGTSFTAQDQGSNEALDSDANPATGRSGSITVASGGTISNVGAGIFAPVSISGNAFTDVNGDGLQGSGEGAFAGQAVQLLNAAGTAVANTTTASNGTYSFTGLAPGQYQVQFTAPAGRVFTAQDVGNNAAVDSDANPGTGRTAVITLASGQTATNVSAGSFVPVSVGGRVFTDGNGDGIQGTGEAGLAGQTVQLLNAAGTSILSTTTGSDGTYSFTGVAPGTYQVQFAAAAGTVFTAQDVGSNDAVDSDASPTTGRTAAFTLASGGAAANLSAGLFAPVSIGGVAFTDANGDGVQGTGEAGVAGQAVQLLNTAGTVVASTTTGTGGAYSFTGVAPGTYQVQFTAPAGTSFTAQDQGSSDAVDSDVNASGRTAAITLASGQTASNVSAGSFTPVSVSGVAFTDTNGDGVQGTGEAGIAGQAVQLLNTAGTVVATTTGTGGAYSFTGVAPGTYQVQFTPLAGTSFTAQDQGGNDAVDSDVNASGRTAAITIASGQTASNVSAGSFTPATLSGVFFTDTNGDGIQGTGEAGVTGQAVQLLNAAGTAVASTTTGTGGAYSFAGVTPGTYQVQFAAPAGSVFTAQDVGNNDAMDSDVNAAGRTALLTLASGQTVGNVSAGTLVTVGVSGVAFTDSNGDGIQGTGENGRAGVAVQLLNAAGTAVASTTTGTGGAYSFTGVAPGTYQVQFTAPAGTVFTTPDQGGNDAVDSDVNASGRTGTVTLASGGAITNLSAGLFTPVSIGGVAFTDTNGDGVQGTGEAGIAGQAVQLLNTAGTAVASTTTGTGGAYSFTGVAPGTYQVQFTPLAGTSFTAQDQGSNEAVDSDVNASGRTAAVTLASGGSIANLSAGSFTPATLGGTLFVDSNGDGIRGSGEAGLAGQAVQLLNTAGTAVASTITGTGGAYSFAGVTPGTYQVQFAAPAGSVFTAQNQGTDETLDSDANAAGRTGTITLVSGQTTGSVSAGTFVPVTVSGVAFADANGDGVQGTGEGGLTGVTVRLLNSSDALVATTTTGAGGAYSFAGVTPGTYQVQFVAPAGASFSAADQGGNDALDSDANPATGRSPAFTLASGGSLANLSAGLYTAATVSGVAFTDSNGDGVQNAGETGTSGVTVQLLNAGGTAVATATTGSNGAYNFTDVDPGTYQVRFVAPAGTSFSARDQGGNDALDSDVGADGRSASFTLASGGNLANLSAGTFAPTSVSGVAFTDTDGDGLRGANEAGTAGVAVQLLNAAGTAVASTTTGSNGAYSFTGVTPGQYQLAFTAPAGTVFTGTDRGNNDGLDSDVGADGRTAAITLTSGQNLADISAGTFTPATVGGTGGFVFTDTDGNGIRGVGEAGLAGATVRLLDAGGNVVGTTATASDGRYSFAGVAPGTYQLQFVAPDGTVFTARDAGSNDAADSDADPTSGRSNPFTLVSGQTLDNIAAGVFTPVSTGAGSVVFVDSNGNGIRDAGEAGLGGVTVQLIGSAGTAVASTVTRADGTYSFANVVPGTYQVQFTAPTGAVFTTPDQGGNDAADSDADPATGRSAAFSIPSGGIIANIGAGLFTPVGLSGTAFTDTNGDGVQNSGEAGLSGVTVQLLNAVGTVVATTVTAAGGGYGFAGLPPGQYEAQFVAPAGTVFTAADQGGNDAVDSDVDAAGRTALLTFAPGSTVANLSAGVFTPASVSGTTFTDSNGDGIQNNGETGSAGQTVQLLNAAGAAVASTTTTGAGGAYSFTGVAPGTYQVQFAIPSGAAFTAPDQGGNDAVDSDANPVTGRSAAFTLASGQAVTNLSAGSFTQAAISGLGNVVFADSNGNGIQDSGEVGLADIAVRLLNAAGTVVATTTTGTGGGYSFGNVTPGTYQLEFVAPSGTSFSPRDQGANDRRDSDVDPNTGRTAAFNVASGSNLGDLAAGLRTSATQLGGDVWLDGNGNGLRDPGEQLLPGVAVRLLDANGRDLGRSTVTDAAGHYVFLGLEAGSYRVDFAPLVGTSFTLQDQGGSEALDSDATPRNGVSSLLVSLAAGTVDGRSSAGLVLDLSQSPSYAPSINLGDANNGFPGTAGPEVLHGNGGDDSLNGLGGNDTFFGEAGRDSLNGHEGDDYLDGGAGDDNVQGQVGNDTLLGGTGNDIGEGGDGNDVLLSGPGDDNMQGESGDDSLFGGAGADLLTGNAGDDLVAGGTGNDTLQGADGNDIVIGGRDGGTMSLGADGHITNIVTGDMLEGNNGADAFVWQAGDGVDLLMDFNPAEGDTLTIYGYSGFQVVERTPEGRMALYLGDNAGFVLNNGTFQGETAASTFAGVHFIPSTAGAPDDIVGRDVVVPVLAANWASVFKGAGPITVSQPFPPLDTPFDPTNLEGIRFDALVQLTSTNDSYALGGGNLVVDAGSGFDVLSTADGFRGVGRALLPDGSLRLDLAGRTDVLRNAEEVRFVDGTLHLSPDSVAAQVVRLYDVALGRGAEQAGLNYWIDQLNAGVPLLNLADGFLGSPEFAARYGNLSNQDYVGLLYQNVLGRPADPAGAAFYEASLAAGTSRATVLVGFSESPENKAASAADNALGIWDVSENAATVARLYDTLLGRQPDLAGLGFYRGQLDSGQNTALGIVQSFTGSPEFQARYGSNLPSAQFVELLYRNTLDRDGTPAEINYYVSQLDAGVLSREQAVFNFSESPEHVALTAPSVISENPAQFGIAFA
ncbi:SdrD B-like domain-containing protein, partial [Roseomonas sp. BN140053]|uniref:SdrD B-like domain-containing protein n=1 Tax=Roseomonas sp. BN140053 TaxID=3391898 RepID=UPI0039E8E3A0